MEASLRNTPALIARIEKLTNDLIRRFETLVALAPVERTDRDFTAHSAYQMEVETAALIRSSEDILTLTRQMQEMWLFGQLDTLGESQAQQKTEQDARAVAEVLARLIQGDTGVKVDGRP
ncbi:mediator complex, subunit Med22 [Cryomyces antarcticus]